MTKPNLLAFAKKVAATPGLPPQLRGEALALVEAEREATRERVARSRANAREREATRNGS